jgi:hypothetical protein
MEKENKISNFFYTKQIRDYAFYFSINPTDSSQLTHPQSNINLYYCKRR